MRFSLLCLLLLSLMLQGCWTFYEREEIPNEAWNDYEPVQMSRDELDASIQLKPSQDISNSGKIYVINDLLFVGEKQQGFHVFDNADPSNPVKISFIEVRGASDVSVRNNMLYINQATDLIALKYDRTQSTIELKKRIKNIFPELRSPSGFTNYQTHADSVVVAWIPKS